MEKCPRKKCDPECLIGGRAGYLPTIVTTEYGYMVTINGHSKSIGGVFLRAASILAGASEEER